MRKLIGMTDFVCENTYKWEMILNYANFLKQPLELWLFVPCGEGGNVLEIIPFNIHRKGSNFEHEQHERYSEAKERCLFEGFEVDLNSKPLIIIKSDYMPHFLHSHLNKESKTIEDLVKYNLQLTQTAIKKLGL